MTTRQSLCNHGIEPRKSLGQNFLVNPAIARNIVDAALIEPGDVVVEIGPGLGALTSVLIQRAAHVVAIEVDRALIPALMAELGSPTNLTLVHADALEVDFVGLVRSAQPNGENLPVRFIGNLPYYITSAIIRRILESELDIQTIIVTVQREVAERMVARPGDMSLLAVSVQFYGQAEIVMRLSPSAFYPQPGVDSAVVRITPHGMFRSADRDTVFKLARSGFSQPRKQLRNTLSGGLSVDKAEIDHLLLSNGIDPSRRAETLTMEEWVKLAEDYPVMLSKIG